MGYVPSKWQKVKNKVKVACTVLGKKSETFKGVYNRVMQDKRVRRYERFTDQPIDKNLVIFESFMGRRYADSPRAIYEYMLNSDGYNGYHFVWIIRGTLLDEYDFLNDKDRTRVVQYGTDEFYSTYAKAGYWISNSRIVNALVPREGQVYVQCWHGTPLKRLAYDINVKGNNELNSKEKLCQLYTIDASKYTYMLSPSAFCSEKFKSAFALDSIGKGNVIIEEGYPRNDFLNNYTKEDVIRVRRALGLPENKKVILYAPTWRDDQHVSGTGYVFDNPLDFDELKRRISDEYVVVFRPHYFIANEFDFDRYKGFVFDASKYTDINDLYIVSDILVTDYSSVFFDYSILRRPILFYMYDLSFYQDTVRGFYISLEELPGPILEEQEELFNKIVNIDAWTSKDEYKEKYETFANRFTYLDDGRASERVVKKIFG